MNPFSNYPGNGRQLLGRPTNLTGACRSGYGLDLQRRTGQTTCAYCGLNLVDTYEHWLLMSVDHVVPRSDALRLGVPSTFTEDVINLVVCCSGCNGFGNRYRTSAPPKATWELADFLTLRDETFVERLRLIADRRTHELKLFSSRPWEVIQSPPPSPFAPDAHPASHIKIGGWDFALSESLVPDRDDAGSILELRPQERFAQADAIPLHQYGVGPFCSFRILAAPNLAGVYALVEQSQVRYIGECEDLRKRFNAGYGNISPRNCYVGGQSTNCKINRRVLEVTQAGGRVDLYFCATSITDRKSIERHVLSQLTPPWNGSTTAAASQLPEHIPNDVDR